MTRRIYIYISRSCHRDRLPTTSCKKDKKKGEDNGPGRVACTIRVDRKVFYGQDNASDPRTIRVI